MQKPHNHVNLSLCVTDTFSDEEHSENLTL